MHFNAGGRIMNRKLFLYFSNLIKEKRKAKELSLENLSSLTALDKGYLSKIENKIVEPSLDLLVNIFDKLGEKFVYDPSTLTEMNEKLDKLYFDMIYLNEIDHSAIKESIFSQEDLFRYSPLVDKYLITKYAYMVTTNEKRENYLPLEKEIETNLINFNIIETNLLQIYYDYKGIALKNESQLNEAIKMCEKSKALGHFKYSYGMVCYHLAVIYSRQNNFLEAHNNAKESLVVFMQEFNLKRQKHSQVHLANIYSVSKQYTKADELYRDLLKCGPSEEIEYIIYLNLAWNLIKQDRFLEAISELLKIREKFVVNMKWYYLLSWCYFKTSQMEESIKIIEESALVSSSDEINKSRIRVIEALISESDNKKKINLISSEYQKYLASMDNEDKKFFLEILVEEYSKIAYYKEVAKHLNELIKL